MSILTPRTDAAEARLTDSPTTMSDATATRLGLKQYLHGTTYNAGLAPTVSGPAGLVVQRAVFIPYQTQDGAWRLRFSIGFNASSSSNFSVAVNGIVAKVVASLRQSFTVMQANTVSTVGGGYFEEASNVFYASFSAAVTIVSISGDVELNAKPTWAY